MDRLRDLTLERLETPLGDLLIVADGQAVRAIDFADCEWRLEKLLMRHLLPRPLAGGGRGGVRAAVPTHPGPSPTATSLTAYFAGNLQAIDQVEIHTNGTPFQKSVWSALRRIPPGAYTTYSRLAAELGKPAASRAVGLANGANPISIVIPCHRLTGADGTLTGYAGGLDRKAWLLQHESGLNPPALPARRGPRSPAPRI